MWDGTVAGLIAPDMSQGEVRPESPDERALKISNLMRLYRRLENMRYSGGMKWT